MLYYLALIFLLLYAAASEIGMLTLIWKELQLTNKLLRGIDAKLEKLLGEGVMNAEDIQQAEAQIDAVAASLGKVSDKPKLPPK